MNKVEIRCELRSENGGRHISGKAISFDTQSNDIGFIEILHRGCISQELIDSSNIVFLYNHDYNQVIARANKGKGTLNIDLRDDGVYFDLEVPNTTMGNDLLENIRLGNITQCSFGFRYSNEEGAYKDEKIGDVWYRNVYKIGELYDLSAVTYPAYDDTYVNARMQERSKMEDKLKKTEEIQEEVRAEEKKEDEKMSDERACEKKSDERASEKNSDEKEINNEDNTKSEEEMSDEEKSEEEMSDEKDSDTDDKMSDKEDKDSDSDKDPEDDSKTDSKDEKRNENKKSYKMKKNIILSEIRSALNSAEHKVTLPAETRTITQTVSGDGVHDEIVEEEFKGLLEPLYADSVISNLGITIYNGLPAGDFKVSAMGKGSAAWADETGTAAESKNTFTHVTLQPKRISAQLSYSKQFLAQDTIGAEAAIRRDIYNALVAQIQSTMLSADASGTNKPAGIFNGVTAKNISSYKELCDVEAAVDDSNVKGERKYLMSNKAKAILRCMPKSSLTTELVLDGNDIDGTPVIANSDVPTTQYAYGDFSNIVMGTWGNVDLIIDPYTLAAENSIRIVVNAFVDWKKVRKDENVIVYGKVSAPAAGASTGK